MMDLTPFLHLMTDAEWLLFDGAGDSAMPLVAKCCIAGARRRESERRQEWEMRRLSKDERAKVERMVLAGIGAEAA